MFVSKKHKTSENHCAGVRPLLGRFMKSIHLMGVSLMSVAQLAVADSEIAPFAKVDRPFEGSCYIKQIPAKHNYITNSNYEVIDTEIAEEAFVNAYKILRDGEDEFLWRSVGWYAHHVFLTNDCEYLVRMGNWARGSEPSAEDLAVAFYKNGELLSSYSTADLIEDKQSVDVSTGHYIWLAEGEYSLRLNQWSDTFYLKTIEGKEFEFNFKTGEIVKTRKAQNN